MRNLERVIELEIDKLLEKLDDNGKKLGMFPEEVSETLTILYGGDFGNAYIDWVEANDQ